MMVAAQNWAVCAYKCAFGKCYICSLAWRQSSEAWA
jgi:hypothetical protein